MEISLFCDPGHQGKRVGTQLLRSLLGALRRPASHLEYFPKDAAAPKEVKQVLAVMAVGEAGKERGLKLREFYEREGFKLVSARKSGKRAGTLTLTITERPPETSWGYVQSMVHLLLILSITMRSADVRRIDTMYLQQSL